MARRLLYVVNVDWFFVSHRLPIALAARDAGWEVHVATRFTVHAARLRAEGLTLHEMPLRRGSRNPLNALAFMISLWRVCRAVRPDVAHAITILPVLLGGLAMQAARVPFIVFAISGLGHVFTARGPAAAAKRAVASILYRIALRRPQDVVIFQNDDDQARVSAVSGLPESRSRKIAGVGVDLERFRPADEAPDRGSLTVLFAARLLHAKGIREFVDAARALANKPLRFIAMGEPDPGNPASVTQSQLEQWRREGAVEWRGHADAEGMAAALQDADMAVLPSYREGFPKSLMEAAACGLPIVTTDVPGCRDAVDDGVTGLLVPARDAEALARAISRLAGDAPLRARMGRAARERAEAAYDAAAIAARHLDVYDDAKRP